MSFLDPLKTPTLLTELRAGSLHLFNGNSGEDLVITTDAEGRPDAASQARVREALLRLAPRKPWQSRGTLWCALPARGRRYVTRDLYIEIHRYLETHMLVERTA